MILTEMIESGSANPLLLFSFALLLGALHGLEPGHSKTMMAAYIVAIQGTVKQAVLLGVSAAFSHSIIVWILAIAALTWGNELIGEQLEPYFLIVSGILVLGIALWMLRQSLPAKQDHSHDHGHAHHHDHTHGHAHDHHHHHSHDNLDAPHLDAHARAHAAEIKARLASGNIGTWQTILFGLTGGLIPCPAAITVFVLCLHLGKLTLGITLVSAFSIGLALTLVGIGIIAAVGLRVVSSQTSRFDRLLSAAPWISAALIACVGLLIIWTGYSHLVHVEHTH
ncbi:MAG: nickel/cobalt efflux transporter [Pseudomonadota bacterium]